MQTQPAPVPMEMSIAGSPCATPAAAGGVLCVCFWPQVVEAAGGPWQRLFELPASLRPQQDWEEGIPGAALREGAELVQVGGDAVQACMHVFVRVCALCMVAGQGPWGQCI